MVLSIRLDEEYDQINPNKTDVDPDGDTALVSTQPRNSATTVANGGIYGQTVQTRGNVATKVATKMEEALAEVAEVVVEDLAEEAEVEATRRQELAIFAISRAT